MRILIRWLHQKPADLDLQRFQKKKINFLVQHDNGVHPETLQNVLIWNCVHVCHRTSSQAKGTKSTSFLTCKERSGLSTLGLRRWSQECKRHFRFYAPINILPGGWGALGIPRE